jgi:hypothetical protein
VFVVLTDKVGRNDPCPCGSGKKFKKCCEMKQRHKKINAQLLSAIVPQAQATQETSKVSSLFFKKTSAPKASPEEPPNPVM